MRNRHRHFIQLEQTLRPLRRVFESVPESTRKAEFFDEFLEANEFELALHTLCDLLMESEGVPITTNLLEIIAELHESMEITDDWVVRLRLRLQK
jgi:hypothetical protein